jgi:hypothetical protein
VDENPSASWVKERVIVALRAATGNAVRMHLSAKRMVSHDTGEMSAEYARPNQLVKLNHPTSIRVVPLAIT